MTLIAYGEIRFLTGESSLFARFAQVGGSTFDMPLSEEQFTLLVGSVVTEEPAAAPQKRAAAPAPYEEDDVEDARPFSVALQSVDEDDDEL